MPGCPDFVFVERRLAVFVDGCFWHGCPRCGHYPRTRGAFWKAKIDRTRDRDRERNKELRKRGWKVLRFWEHDLQSKLEQCVQKVRSALGRR